MQRLMAQSAWVVLRGSGLPRGCGPGCVDCRCCCCDLDGVRCVAACVCVSEHVVAACGWLHVAVTVLRALETKDASRS